MAKLTLLQILNAVERNVGVTETTSSIEGISLTIFHEINEVLMETGVNDLWKPLEADRATMTLTTGLATHTIPSDFSILDKDSFIFDNARPIPYKTPQEIDFAVSNQTATGYVEAIFEFNGFFRPYRTPSTNENGKTINYRYWKLPTILSTSTSTGTSWIPEGFDSSFLVNAVTFRVMHYLGSPEAQIYQQKAQAGLNNMKRWHGSAKPQSMRVGVHF